VLYDKYKDPMYPDALAKPTAQLPTLGEAYAHDMLTKELYRCERVHWRSWLPLLRGPVFLNPVRNVHVYTSVQC
jgi:hypothetical protein